MNIKNTLLLTTDFFKKPKTIGFLVSFWAIIITLYLVNQQYVISKENKRKEMEAYLNVIQTDIENSIKQCYSTTLTLALTINDKGEPENFEKIAASLIANNSFIQALELVPKGVIKYIYPLEGNKTAFGLNILSSLQHRKEALKSIEDNKMYFAGPIDLIQGGKGIVGRLPVFKNNQFWGFSALVIKLECLYDFFGINYINNSKYYFQLSKIDTNNLKEIHYLSVPSNFKELRYVTSFIPDSDWKLYLIEKEGNSMESLLVLIAILGVVLSVFAGYVTVFVLKKPVELELLLTEQANEIVTTELKFKTIFEQAAVGIVSADTKTGKLLAVNNQFCNMLGYTKEELLLLDFKDITHPEDINTSISILEKIKTGVFEDISIEKRYLTKKGDVVWANITVSGLREDTKDSLSHIVIIENITDRKIAENKSVEYQKRIESLINTIDGIVWECNADTLKFNFISKKVENILGYSAQEWMAVPDFWNNHIHEDDIELAMNYCSTQTKLKNNHDFEYRMYAKDGRIVWMRDIVNVVIENDTVVLLRGIMIDITKGKEIQMDLNKSFQLVSEQNKRLVDFSYIVSHNLRSHTSNITSLINLIETCESQDETKELFGMLKSVSNTLNDTLENLNEVVNIHANLGLNIKKLRLIDYVDKSLNFFRESIILKDIKIIVDIAKDVEIDYNPAYLENVLNNLISNAIRYADLEKMSQISISFTQEENDKVLVISDNGQGIDLNQNKARIFGLYKTFTTHQDSKGMGLFITKNQIEAMGGFIKVESELNVGTTFKIYIV